MGWSVLPTVGGLVDLVGIRNTLRAKNLYDTGVPDVTGENPLPPHPNVEVWRTADGTPNVLVFIGSPRVTTVSGILTAESRLWDITIGFLVCLRYSPKARA